MIKVTSGNIELTCETQAELEMVIMALRATQSNETHARARADIPVTFMPDNPLLPPLGSAELGSPF